MSKLLLHEAIAIILLSKKDRTTSIEEIALEINKRGLYQRKTIMKFLLFKYCRGQN